MKNPASNTEVTDGYGAYSCNFRNDNPLHQFSYLEIQVHPNRARIDVYIIGRKRFSEWFTQEDIRGLSVALCNGGDCVGQLADAVEESGEATIPLYLRMCGEMLSKYYAYREQAERNQRIGKDFLRKIAKPS